MKIQPETPEDQPAIRNLHQAAFPGPEEAKLVDQLRADGDSVISLTAVQDKNILGHVLFSPMTAPFKALGLAPVAVRPSHQGAGIGSALIRAGIDMAKAQGWEGIFVLGDPAYYQRFGFDPAKAKGFSSPYAGPHLMLLPLTDHLPVTGEIAYAEAFAALG